MVERTRISILKHRTREVMKGDKKENSKFQSEFADLITSKGPTDPWAAYCFPKLFILNLMWREYFSKKQNGHAVPIFAWGFFLVVMFVLKPGSKLRLGKIIRSKFNEAGGDINWMENPSGRQFALEVFSCLSHGWAEFLWKLMEISNPNLRTVIF